MRLPAIASLRFLSRTLAVAVALALFPQGAAFAQDAAPEVVALVNDEPFTQHDLSQRISLALFASGLDDTAENRSTFSLPVLNSMIDEYLQVTDAFRRGLQPNTAELDRAVARVATQNGLTVGAFLEELESKGVSRAIFEENMMSQFLWNETVRRHYRNRIRVSDREVELFLLLALTEGRDSQVALSEIFLPVSNREFDTEGQTALLRLREAVLEGANFASIAEQFSGSATAVRGGSLGWAPERLLSDARREALTGIELGGVTEPFRESGGWTVLLLRERRSELETGVPSHLIRLSLSTDADLEDAQDLRSSLSGCRAVRSAAADLGEGSGDLGRVRVEQLADNIAPLLEGTAPGDLSAIAAGDDVSGTVSGTERGPTFYALCPPAKGEPVWDEALNFLGNERLGALLRNTLRRLRREAEIEIRL